MKTFIINYYNDMKKVRPNAKWSGLSPGHLATLESWLFEEHLTFDDAFAKAKAELGFAGSRSGLHRFYQGKARERRLKDLEESAASAAEIGLSPGTEGTLRNSAMKLLAERFLRHAIEDGGMDMAAIARTLMQSEANEIQRQANEIKLAAQELRRQRLEFQRQAWEFAKIEKVVEAVPKFDKLAITGADQQINYYKNKRINIRNRALYGALSPKDLEAEGEREMEAWEREQAELRERSNGLQSPTAVHGPTADTLASPPESGEAAGPAIPENGTSGNS